LQKKGAFTDKGTFDWTDGNGRKHRQDSFEAVFEQVTGQPLSYPEPRYGDIVLMNPATYAWQPLDGAPGVAEKLLGVFTERETRIAMLRLDAGAAFAARAEAAPLVLFVAKGSVWWNGHDYGVESAFGLEP